MKRHGDAGMSVLEYLSDSDEDWWGFSSMSSRFGLHGISHVAGNADHPEVSENIQGRSGVDNLALFIGTNIILFVVSSNRTGTVRYSTVDKQRPIVFDVRKDGGIRLVQSNEFGEIGNVAVVIAAAGGVLHAQAINRNRDGGAKSLVVVRVECVVSVTVNVVEPETREDKSNGSEWEQEWDESERGPSSGSVRQCGTTAISSTVGTVSIGTSFVAR